jgi:antitoxin ParD1/3/4
MPTLKISLSVSLQAFVDGQAAERGLANGSEYVRELIRQDQDRQVLRAKVLEGAASPLGGPANRAYFERLRDRVRNSDASGD